MGFEGANVIFDTWIHPLVMGLEEHLLHMFREDFEFNDAAGPSHHGGHQPSGIASVQLQVPAAEEQPSGFEALAATWRSGWRKRKRS